VKVKELIGLLEADCWLQVRMKGSHRQFHHPVKRGTVTVSGEASIDVPPGNPEQRSQTGWAQEVGVVAMRYLVIVEKGPTSYGAYVPDLPGCVAVGDTRDEVLAAIHEAIEFHLEGLKQDGERIPQPSSSSEVIEVAA